MKSIAIYGTGGMGREILVQLEQMNLYQKRWNIIGFFDYFKRPGTFVDNYPVLGGSEELNEWKEPLDLIIGVGTPHIKKLVLEELHNEMLSFPSLVHPSVQIEDFQKINIGEGTIIGAGNIFTTNINIGKYVLVNLNCTIGHDVNIGDFSTILSGCHVSGNVNINNSSYMGTGSMVVNNVNVAEKAIIGAGAVVLNDVDAEATVVGVPARPINKK